MTNILDEGLGISMSGVQWDFGEYKLFQSTKNNVILFTKTTNS